MNFQKHFPQAIFLKNKEQSYLDSAATTLKLQCVIDTLTNLYEKQIANAHRGDHYLSDKITLRYEQARTQVQQFINATEAKEVIFTKSATDSINFLAHSLSPLFKEGDEILLTEMEHHSNLLPWQILAKAKKLTLKYVPVDNNGELVLSQLDALLTSKAKLFCFGYYSNALGTRNPVEKLCAWAKKHQLLSVIDAAQAMTIEPVDVQKIDCDFLVFSSHKLFSPEGSGVLYVKKKHLEELKPYQHGGGMVKDVSLGSCELADKPHCFEAGTPSIGAVLALNSVLEFLNKHQYFNNAQKHSQALLHKAEEELTKIKGVKIIGPSVTRVNILSFIVEPFHCRDMGELISQAGVAVRSGHHCCLPLMKRYQLPSGTIRASFAIYNDEQDVTRLIVAVKKALSLLS